MPHHDLGDRSLYYELHGTGEPLVCVTGLAADVQSWSLQLRHFARRHRTLVLDNRDAGRSSPATGEYETSDMAQDVLALADALGLDRFHLLGVSLGGSIVQELALAAPERVRTLTVAVGWAGGGAHARQQAEVWSRRRARLSFAQHVDELMVLMFSEGFFEDADAVAWVRDLMIAQPAPQSAEAFGRQLRAGCRHETRDRLAALRMPAHVILADRDLLVPAWKACEVAELLPHAKVSVVERAAHAIHVERAAEFNRLVLSFLAEHADAAAP